MAHKEHENDLEITELEFMLAHLEECDHIIPYVYDALKYILKARRENIQQEK